MKAFNFPEAEVSSAGVVTLTDWTMMPDGRIYTFVWCPRWEVIPDKAVPIEGFKSSEHWQLAAVVGGDVLALIPGCKVAGWAYCTEPPKATNLYVIK